MQADTVEMIAAAVAVHELVRHPLQAQGKRNHRIVAAVVAFAMMTMMMKQQGCSTMKQLQRLMSVRRMSESTIEVAVVVDVVDVVEAAASSSPSRWSLEQSSKVAVVAAAVAVVVAVVVLVVCFRDHFERSRVDQVLRQIVSSVVLGRFDTGLLLPRGKYPVRCSTHHRKESEEVATRSS